ncbi:hypothetical protein [Microbacterium sp.]|uniref:hypothetical protein n=1 Tax=Microbacterium sp. TaxID=51671 RepID=UPI0031FEB5F7|nr:hypothetical protein [Microbacterium sp.]
MTDESQLDDLFSDALDDSSDSAGADDQPVAEPPTRNRYERMTLAEVSRLAAQAIDPNHDIADEPLPGPFGAMSDDEILAVIEESRKPVELIDWDAADVTPAVALARQHVEVRDAGLDGELAERVLSGQLTLQEATLRREASIEAGRLIDAQPSGLTDRLDDAEFENLIAAAKQGWGHDVARRLARQKGLAS